MIIELDLRQTSRSPDYRKKKRAEKKIRQRGVTGSGGARLGGSAGVEVVVSASRESSGAGRKAEPEAGTVTDDC